MKVLLLLTLLVENHNRNTRQDREGGKEGRREEGKEEGRVRGRERKRGGKGKGGLCRLSDADTSLNCNQDIGLALHPVLPEALS